MSFLLLQNMVFYGYHGHLAEENRLGQRFNVDLALTLDITEAAASDDLSKTVDYTRVHALCREHFEEHRYRLIETLAERLADRILLNHPRVLAVELTIRKPAAPRGRPRRRLPLPRLQPRRPPPRPRLRPRTTRRDAGRHPRRRLARL